MLKDINNWTYDFLQSLTKIEDIKQNYIEILLYQSEAKEYYISILWKILKLDDKLNVKHDEITYIEYVYIDEEKVKLILS